MRKAVWACLPFSAAVFASAYLFQSAALLWIALCCAFASLSVLVFRKIIPEKIRLRALICFAGAAVGFFCFWMQNHFLVERCERLTGETKYVTVRVVAYPEVYSDSEYVTVRMEQYGLPQVKCQFVTYDMGSFSSLIPGDRLTLKVEFTSATVRDGEEIDTYVSRGIFLRGSAVEFPSAITRHTEDFRYWPARLAHFVQETCRSAFPADTSPFFEALLTGSKTSLYSDGSHYDFLRDAGLAHVVAVSGMHISYLLGFFFLLAGHRKRTVIGVIPILVLFAALTGFTPSVCRAVMMQMFLLAAPLCGRQPDAPTAFAVSLAILLAINPCAAASISLQLSYASVGGIYLFAEKIFSSMLSEKTREKKSFSDKAKCFLGSSISTSIATSALTVPVTVLHFGTLSVISPISNILCLWMISTLYIGGYVLVLITSILPMVGIFLGNILAWGVRYLFFVTSKLCLLPCATVSTEEPVFTAWLLLAYALFFGAWFLSRKERRFRPVVPICLALISLYGAALGLHFFNRDGISYTALDVGQGSCSIICCDNHTVVIDCGGSYSARAGNRAVNYLKGQQRNFVDALVLTHLHADHCNGAAELLRRVNIGTLYLPAVPDDDGKLGEILDAADDAGTEVMYIFEDEVLSAGNLTLTLFSPVLAGTENENCLIALASCGNFDILITGDSPSAAERVLCAHHTLPDSEVLVVGHHGSSTSTSQQLLNAITPDVAVISVGYNSYGHPHYSVLERLKNNGIPYLRTDEEGNITLTPET